MAVPPWLEAAPQPQAAPYDEAAFELAWSQQSTVSLPPEVPVWEFLNWVSNRGCLLHGSQEANLTLLSPRTPNDHSPDDFSKRTAVFATSNALWAMTWALRGPMVGGTMNTCIQLLEHLDPTRWYHFFSVAARGGAQVRDPRALLAPGYVYALRPTPSEQMPPYEWPGLGTVREPQLACSSSVAPLARFGVNPCDLPLRVHAHDQQRSTALARTDPWGFPWEN